MNGNRWSVSAACILVGLLGFLVGKLTNRSNDPADPAEALMNQAQEIINAKSQGKVTGFTDNELSKNTRNLTKSSGDTWEARMSDMEEIVRGENALSRSRAMLLWIDSLAPSEFEAAIEHFRQLGITDDRRGEYAMLLTAWAELDPQAALTYATANTRGMMATNTIISAWADRDPEAALAWAKQNHTGDAANPYLVGIIRSLAVVNPARATEILQTMPFSEERGKALDAILPHLLKNGVDAAKTWIAELSDERLRQGAMARLAPEISKSDPEAAAQYILENPNEATSRVVDDVYSNWAKKDRSKALESFNSLPKGDARQMALRGIVLAGTESDVVEAAALMNQYPDDVNDGTAMRFVWYSFDKNPALAVNQIGLIQDKGFQNRMYGRSLSAWLDADSKAANDYINSSNLPEEVLQRIRRSNSNP